MKNYLQKLKISLIVTLLPIFMFLIFGPTEIFYANISDFDFELRHFIWLFTGLALMVWLVFSVIIALLPDKVNSVVNSLVVVFSLSAYIQNAFFNVKLMGTVGNAMDWGELKSYTVINTIVWFAMLVIFTVVLIVLKNSRNKVCVYISVFLTLIQLVAFISVCSSLNKDEYKISHYKLSPEKEFEFAKDENVILLLLDATSERFFEEELAKSPEMIEGLEDFTFYNNYEPCYKTTCPAVTYLWTGLTPDCSVNRLTWLKNAWHCEEAEDLFKRIHDKGWACRFYTNHQGVVFGDTKDMIGKVDNVILMNGKVNVRLMIPLLEKYTIYRYAPYILKPRFEVNLDHFRGVTTYEEEFDHNEAMINFYERIQEKPITVNDDLSKLVYYHHFDGIHGPWIIDANGNRVEQQDDLDYRKEVVRGDFVSIKYFLNQLKEAGIYDSSTIIISADHGSVVDDIDLHCIFFIKQKDEHHDSLIINEAPISADDFRASLLMFIGDENYTDFGTTYFDWNPGDSRDRYSMVRDLGGKDGFYGYLYNGDDDDLEATVLDGIDTEIPNFGGWCQ